MSLVMSVYEARSIHGFDVLFMMFMMCDGRCMLI